ncbi:unannotated protein [freshwater metagenome]|uniref:Unannotated protein n=1 Tax=freshwater metagenome TaxID=449393 RepID=A0A6J7HPI7_9ZZZZ
MSAVNSRNPIAHGLIDGILERLAPRSHWNDFGPKESHTHNIEGLSSGVFLAHVNRAVEAHHRCCRRRRDAVLAGARLGNHALLAHSKGQQRLTKNIVDLVRSGVIEIFALEQHAGTAAQLREPSRVCQRTGSTSNGALQTLQFLGEFRVNKSRLECCIKFVEGRHQGLWHKSAAVISEVLVVSHGQTSQWC